MCPLWQQGLPILRNISDKVRQQGIFNLTLPCQHILQWSNFAAYNLLLCCSGTSATRRWRGRGRPARRPTRPPAAAGSGSPAQAPPELWPPPHSRSTQLLQCLHTKLCTIRSNEASINECTQVNFLWIDDVWVTGYLAQHLSIQHQARLHMIFPSMIC